MKRPYSTCVLAVLATTVLSTCPPLVVTAFSPPGAVPPAPRPATRTERNYGSPVDDHVTVFTTQEEASAFDSLSQLEKKNRPSSRRKEIMQRPKSLNSKIETHSRQKKKREQQEYQEQQDFPHLLSRDEEAHLSDAIRKLRTAIRIRDELVANHVHPDEHVEIQWQPTETEWAIACGMSVMQLRRVMNEGQEARTKLVDANGGLVKAIAKKHFYSVKQANQAGGGLGSILTLQDMIQEGNLGLMEAAERFEPERGNKFSTYATYWIRQRILRSISEYSRTIRLPAHGESR